MDLKKWLKANNYKLITLAGGDKGFYIDPKDRAKVFKYLENRDAIKDWDYRGNYTYILVTLREVK